MKKRIFISHTNSDAESNRFLQPLCDSLSNAGLDVLIDRHRLEAGASWRNEIYTWLSICHGAVVLLSGRAIEPESIWVPRETELLMWRKALDPKLTIIPVMGSDVSFETVSSSSRFRDLQLQELQSVSLKDPYAALQAIIAGLDHARLIDRSPFDELADLIVARLDGLNADMLDYCAHTLLGDVEVPEDVSNVVRLLAVKLLSCDLDNLSPVFDRLMSRCPVQRRGDIAEAMAMLGANWVNPSAAQWIAHECARPANGRVVRPIILNASTQFAVEMYLQRASAKPPRLRWPLVTVTGVSGSEDSRQIVDEVDAALQAQMPLPPDPFEKNQVARRRRQLERMRKLGIPVFLAMPLPLHAESIRHAVADAFPNLNLIFLSGGEQADKGDYPGSRFLHLEPHLAEDAEYDARSLFDSLMTAYNLQSY